MDVVEFIENMGILELKKGDLIVVKIDGRIPAERVKHIESAVRSKLPEGLSDVGIIVIDSAAEIGILRKGSDENQ